MLDETRPTNWPIAYTRHKQTNILSGSRFETTLTDIGKAMCQL